MKRSATARSLLLGLIAVGSGVAAAGVLAAANPGVSHGGGPADIEGSYEVTIDVQNPPLGAFPDLMTFTDGTVVTTRPLYIASSPAGPLLESPGHGAYSRAGHKTFSVALLNLLQGAPGNNLLPNGAFFGTERIHWDAEVDERRGTISGPWSSTVTDPNGNVLFSVSGVIQGNRITTP